MAADMSRMNVAIAPASAPGGLRSNSVSMGSPMEGSSPPEGRMAFQTSHQHSHQEATSSMAISGGGGGSPTLSECFNPFASPGPRARTADTLGGGGGASVEMISPQRTPQSVPEQRTLGKSACMQVIVCCWADVGTKTPREAASLSSGRLTERALRARAFTLFQLWLTIDSMAVVQGSFRPPRPSPALPA